jgi:hypothetical protein
MMAALSGCWDEDVVLCWEVDRVGWGVVWCGVIMHVDGSRVWLDLRRE